MVGGHTFAPEPLQTTKMPEGPWLDLAIDLCGPVPTGESVIVLVDYYSRWVEATVTKSTTSETIITWLRHVFSVHGIPASIKSDNGPQFISQQFREFIDEFGIKHIRVTPYWPQANGAVERMNQAFMKTVKAAKVDMRNWRKELTTFLMTYRSTPHFTTGVTPAKLLFGRQMRIKLPQISLKATDNFEVLARERDHVMEEKAKTYTDLKRKANICDLQPQDKVLLKQERVNKLSTAFEQVPYTVLEKRGNCLVLQSSDGRTIKRNVTQVKRYIHDYQRQLIYDVDNDVLDCEFDYVFNQPIPVVQHEQDAPPPAPNLNNNDIPQNQNNRHARNVRRPQRFNNDYVYN